MSAKLKPYSELIDSGVKWLGEIPKHWTVRKLRHVSRTPIKNGVGEKAQKFHDHWPRYIRITDIMNSRRLRDANKVSLPPQFMDIAPVEQGDLLFAAVGATVGKVYLHTDTSIPACFAGYLVRWSPSAEVISEWASYWAESVMYWNQIRSNVIKSTIENFSASKYRAINLPLPPLSEQIAIAQYLDYMNRRIQRLIRAKQKLTALLTEQKQAIIHRAVTRGLDPNVPSKDSGIEWLGKVPKHWEVRRLGSIGVFSASGIDKKIIDEEPLVRMVNYLDIYNNPSHQLSNLRNYMIISCPAWKTKVHDVKIGDMFFTPSSETPEEIGISAVCVESLSETVYSYHIVRFRTSIPIDLNFKKYWCNNQLVLEQFSLRCKGTTRQILTRNDFRTVSVTLPPFPEQVAIAEYLDRVTADIDAAIARAHREIELLEEYRTRLISDVVTGKLDVREAAAALPEVDPLAEDDEPDDDLDPDTTPDEEYETLEEEEA